MASGFEVLLFCPEQFLGFPRQMQRQIGNRPILPIAPFEKAQGVGRLALGDIALKGRGGLVLAALGLHRDDLRL